MDYKAELKLTTADGLQKVLTGTLSDSQSMNAIDFMADFSAHTGKMLTAQDWNSVFAAAISQGVTIHCLEQNTDATRHDFTSDGHIMQAFMPRGSYGMQHRSVNINLGKCNGPVNVSFQWMSPDPASKLFVNGGGKWGPAIQYGPIQSGSTGGIRFMPVWADGGHNRGQQDITVAIQNQPDGGQWLQPPYYGYRAMEANHWYNIHLRMIGGSTDDPSEVFCQYWKDDDPVMEYHAQTTNYNAEQGKASVMIDWTCFFGGTAPNAAPADAYFNYRNLRIWVEA